QSVVAIASSESVALSWKPVAGASGYRLYWSDVSPVPASAARIDGVASPYRHSGLANGLAYHYVVVALDGAHEGVRSDEARATPKASTDDYDPAWAAAGSTRTLTVDFDARQTSSWNGAALKAAMRALQPGDRLEIGTGVFSIDSLFDLDIQGTAA